MVELNFPPIQKSMTLARDNASSPKNYIRVIHNTAVIIGNDYVFCFNIKTYFEGSGLVPEDQMGSFSEFLGWLEGKTLTINFWEKLVGKQFFQVLNDECINISSEKTNFDLYYEIPENYIEQDFIDYMEIFKNQYKSQTQGVYSFSPKTDAFGTFIKGFGTMIKKMQMVIKFKFDKNYTVFTIDNMPYIFGMFTSDSSINERSYQFDEFTEFVNKI